MLHLLKRHALPVTARLHILRSGTDRRSMQLLGNLLTHYHYQRSLCQHRTDRTYQIQVKTANGQADLYVAVDLSSPPAAPPEGSSFKNFTEARKVAGPLPFTFDYERQTHSIIRVEGVRQKWTPRPVSVAVRKNTFLEHDPFRSARPVLANAFFLEDVSYAWRPGIRERLL